MENLIKNLHTFVSIAIKNPCTDLCVQVPELMCCLDQPKTSTYLCRYCAFETPNTKDTLSVIKIIGEHSERTD